MGPLALLDLIGLDTSLSILEVLHGEFGLSRYVPAPLLRRLADAGRTGRKAGRGIYDYASGSAANLHQDGNVAAAAPPDTVTLIGSGDDAEAELASALAIAGINVTRNASHPSDLILIAAAAGQPVLPAALAAGRADQAVGLHVPSGLAAGSLAEVVRTSVSSAAAVEAAKALAAKLGLAVVCAPDRPGFLVGALLYPHLADAVRMVQDGYASAGRCRHGDDARLRLSARSIPVARRRRGGRGAGGIAGDARPRTDTLRSRRRRCWPSTLRPGSNSAASDSQPMFAAPVTR